MKNAPFDLWPLVNKIQAAVDHIFEVCLMLIFSANSYRLAIRFGDFEPDQHFQLFVAVLQQFPGCFCGRIGGPAVIRAMEGRPRYLGQVASGMWSFTAELCAAARGDQCYPLLLSSWGVVGVNPGCFGGSSLSGQPVRALEDRCLQSRKSLNDWKTMLRSDKPTWLSFTDIEEWTEESLVLSDHLLNWIHP